MLQRTLGRLEMGRPHPLGATFDGLGVNFAVFSAHAEAMELCLFDATGHHELARLPLPGCSNGIFHGYLPDAKAGLLYGYRAYGPYAPEEGHRFNPNKLLLDPYSKQLAGALRWSDSLFGFRLNSTRADLSFDRRDSGAAMIKSVVTEEAFHWADDKRPNTPWPDTVIYEAHVKGLTQLLEDVPEGERGTYAGLGHPAVIGHLRKLGVTAIELLPIHAFLQDRRLVKMGLANYWGYNTISFFAPEARYGSANDLRHAIRRLHSAGIEVILDVVYNHTCEGNELGPTLSWRGLDNANYYRLLDDDKRRYANDTGTGNTIDLTHPQVLRMVTDSLRYFAESFHVDGFRFDLGATLGREHSGFDPGSGFFDAVLQDPVLSQLKLISEPWDIGPGGYQLGNHPPGFFEWNDRYRDTVRRFWRGDESQRPDLAARLSGSSDIFGFHRRPPPSVNFVACHDGATLHDLTAYEGKHNEANGEDNRDGTSENLSRNWGVEGPTDDEGILAIRDRVTRSYLVTLFASLGTPMLLAGDEFGRTQRGNNNAYCQDNEISWLDWSLTTQERGRSLIDFTARLIRLRKDHAGLRVASLPQGREEMRPEVNDLEWFDERGVRLSENDWQNPQGRALVMRRAILKGAHIEIVALLLNGSDAAIDFTLAGDFPWRVLADSAEPQKPEGEIGKTYKVQEHAAVLVAALADPGS